jgi:DNA repair exonuclease SbcCD ATPase subunit
MDTLAHDAPNPREVIGGNNPPAPTLFELSVAEVEGIYVETKNWTGKPVTSAEEETAVARLIELWRGAKKTAEERAKAETDELQRQVKDIQARWNTLIGNNKSITGKAILGLDVLKEALRPWLEEKDRLQREAAERVRRRAEELRRQAAEAQAAASRYDIEEREAAEAAHQQAQAAEKAASRAEKAKPQAAGATRAIGLRKTYTAEVIDYRAFLNHIAATYAEELRGFLDDQARRLVAGGFRELPGVTVHEGTKV